jgi:hypothetical protein
LAASLRQRCGAQRRMGHHSAAFILDHYGHLIDGDLGERWT